MNNNRGSYFSHSHNGQSRTYDFDKIKDQLPIPISSHQTYVDMYWFTVKTAFRNAKAIQYPSRLISDFQDSAFNQNLFLWDSCFISRFLSPFEQYLPGIRTLDNFYHIQQPSGLIPREIHKITGEDYFKWVNAQQLPLHSFFHLRYRYRGLGEVNTIDQLKYYDLGRKPAHTCEYTLDALNHPIFGYAEYYRYLHTGDSDRLVKVHDAIYHHYLALWEHLRHVSYLFVTDWASLDNSTRNEKLFLGIDISSEMVLLAKNLVDIYSIINDNQYDKRVSKLNEDIILVTQAIQKYMWDEQTKFFYDLDENMIQIPIKSIAGFWPLLAGICTEEQAKHLSKWLLDTNTFNRVNVVPSLAADEPGFDPRGGYWRGGVWASTNLMVTDGLERYHRHDLAKKIALKYLAGISKVFEDTHTLWELYPPDELSKGDSDHRDFVGWTGIGPVLYFIQYYLGFKVNAITRTLYWDINTSEVVTGIRQFPFFGCQANLLATSHDNVWSIVIDSDQSFNLVISIKGKNYTRKVVAGTRFDLSIDKL